jgi:DNA-directed RNA polymerase subunit RPC12/RpoP
MPSTHKVAKPHECLQCGKRFKYLSSLNYHNIFTTHKVFTCHYCDFKMMHLYRLSMHIREAHGELCTCHECGEIFETQGSLNWHALSMSHAAFKCTEGECQGIFTRLDVYRRHLLSHKDSVTRYPCPHCKRHRGDSGFKRKDHLTQHLRKYHLIGLDEEGKHSGRSCPHKDCPDYRETLNIQLKDHAFQKISEFTAHMRNVHRESPFPCPEPGCDRIAARGYFRMRDLIKHQRNQHSAVE